MTTNILLPVYPAYWNSSPSPSPNVNGTSHQGEPIYE